MCGVDQKKHLPVTEPKPFSFQSDSRLEHRKKLDEEKKEKEKALKQQHQLEHVTEKVFILNLNPPFHHEDQIYNMSVVSYFHG